ncbi:MAG TPA: hypothetical protein DIW47_15930 [Bacteroidetes bacterium]|nr:hypothetical protein [Bacteroidota bacterium]
MKRFLVVLVLLLNLQEARGSHFESVYISYRTLNDSFIEVNLHTFQYCYGAQMTHHPYEISYGTTTITDTVRYASQRNVTPRGPGCPDTCINPYPVKEKIFKDTIDVTSISDCSIRISILLYNRTYGNNEPAYVFTEFNRCLGAGNSSPVFDPPMPRVLYSSETNFMFYDAKDIYDQRDSISFALLEPAYKANNVPITYTGNFSPKQPLSYTGFPNTPLRYSNSRGWIEVIPNQGNSVAYLGGDIYEWFDSSGTKILASKTHFDHLCIVLNTTYPTPTPQLSFDGGGLGSNGAYDPCGDTVQNLNYTLSDSGDSLTYFIVADAPITYSVVDTNESYKNITLSVSIPDSLLNDTFYVRIYAKDDNCTLAKERNFLLSFVRFPKPENYTPPKLDSLALCNGYKLTLSDPAQQLFNFKFANNKDTQSFYYPQAGYHPVAIRVGNSYSCSVIHTDSVFLPLYGQVQANITYPTLYPCPGTGTVFAAAPSGGTGPYKIQWTSIDTGLNYTAYVSDSLLLQVKTTDAVGCRATDTFLLRNSPKLFASIIGNPWQCYDNGLPRYDAAGIVGTPPYNYDWSGLGTLPYIYIDPSADTTLVIKVTDANGCIANDTMRITRYVGPPANAGSDQDVCGGYLTTLQAIVGPNFSATYYWSGIGSGSSISYIPTKSGFVFLEVSDSLGCLHRDSLYMEVLPKAEISIQGTDSLCEHEQVNLSATPLGTSPFQISWTGGPQQGSGSNYSFTAGQSASIRSILIDANGCRDTANTAVVVFPFDTITFLNPVSALCENQQPLDLRTWVTPSQGSWSGKGVNGFTFYADSAGVGQALIHYQYGTAKCFDRDSLLLDIQKKPAVDFEADTLYGPIPLVVQFTNKTPGNYQWFWNFGVLIRLDDTSSQKNPVYTYAHSGKYNPRLVAFDAVCRDSLIRTAYIDTWPGGVESVGKASFQVYPNPFSNSLTIANPELDELNWSLYATDGKLVAEGTVSSDLEVIDTRMLVPGLYLIRVNGVGYRVIRE